jgi:hypothetical protein
VIFDVDEDQTCHIADPNIPDPEETVRIVSRKELYTKWAEKWPRYLVRRPALCISREVTPDGRQVMATNKRGNHSDRFRAMNTLRQHVEPKMLAKHLVSALGAKALEGFLAGLADEHHYPLVLGGSETVMLLEALKYTDVDTVLDEMAREFSDRQLFPALHAVAKKHFVRLASEEPTVADHPLIPLVEFERLFSARFEECPDKEKGCMSAEEVSEVVGPEFAEQQDKYTGTIGDGKRKKKKKANPRLSSEAFHRLLEGQTAEVEVQTGSTPRKARFEEGKEMSAEDVAKYLREHGAPEAAEKWLSEHEKHKDKLKKASPVQTRVRLTQRRTAKRKRLTGHFPKGLPGIHVPRQKQAARITADAIENTFRDVEPKNAQRLAKALSRAYSDKDVSKALQLANEVLDGFGVEAIEGIDTWSNYYGEAVATYVNTGDTYNPTIIYDIGEGKFHLTDYGTWVEQYERGGGRIKAAKWSKQQPKTVADWLVWEA